MRLSLISGARHPPRRTQLEGFAPRRRGGAGDPSSGAASRCHPAKGFGAPRGDRSCRGRSFPWDLAQVCPPPSWGRWVGASSPPPPSSSPGGLGGNERVPKTLISYANGKDTESHRGDGGRGSGIAAGWGAERNLDLRRLPSSSSPQTLMDGGRVAQHRAQTPREKAPARLRRGADAGFPPAQPSRRSGQNGCRGTGLAPRLASPAKPPRDRRRDVGTAARPALGRRRRQPGVGREPLRCRAASS